MRKVAIYGTGNVGKTFYEKHDFKDENLVAFIETEPSKLEFLGINVVGIKDIGNDIDIIYIANSYVETLYKCLDKGISKKNLVIENKFLCSDYVEQTGRLDIEYDLDFAIQYEFQLAKPEYVMTRLMKKELKVYEKELISNNSFITSEEYCRYATLELIIEEIKENNIEGELAELGVFRGDFSKYMNKEKKKKKLYLFDTFGGFDARDVDVDIKNNFTKGQWFEAVENFKNTDENLVIRKMKYPDNCVVRKGYFPDTIPENEVTYSLVSIDCDLYMPILEGLRYFYPRMNVGGYIMLHDYNTPELKGVKKAVKDYECEIGRRLVKVPISDSCGTLVIGK